MKVHEYQAKQLLAECGIPVPRGGVARKASEAKQIAADLGGKVVIKAQVHAGGRGKAGGIKVASSPDEAEKAASEMIGSRLVTHQTSPQGVPMSAVLIEEAIDIEREIYLGVAVDNAAGMVVIMASEAGGIEIEEIARTSPDKILRAHIDPALGVHPFRARRLAFDLNLAQAQIRTATEIIINLYKLFQAKDCSLAEINPLAITSDGRILAADAKLNFDDNASYRQRAVVDLRDTEQEDPLEVEAKSKGIDNYVKLDGDIGCIVNGAGLAMAVLDLLKQTGGGAANFLDIGTLNDPERVVRAFQILLADSAVKAVLVNIFGGMARVDIIAEGIVAAANQMAIKAPLVVRLAGTNVDQGERILDESGLSIIRAYSLHDAAQKAVEAAKRNS